MKALQFKRSSRLTLACCTLLSVGIIVTLYALSPLTRDIPRGGFERSFFAKKLTTPDALIDLEVNSFYIAGTDHGHVYLGNTTAPFHVAVVSSDLKDSSHVMLKVHMESILEPRQFKLQVKPPYFYLMHGLEPAILRGLVKNWEAYPFMTGNDYYFVESTPIGKEAFALRSYDGNSNEYILARKAANQLEFKPSLLTKQIDGIFCVDGTLHYSQNAKRMVYVYFYRNQFIVADSNMDLQYRGHTIDTFSRARLEIAQIKKSGKKMLAKPPLQVNGLSCVADDKLYIQSTVLADNDSPETFMNGATIDAYSIKNGAYLGSLHVPNYKNQRLNNFQVSNGILFAIFDQYLLTYDLEISEHTNQK
ncbi:hypothetical protein [Dawidia soli]|uniref:Uncharacterized protein n=1 Tax=Dawidia soli TaxID=2782352 RepID=A0AAP2GJA9_9BACT|nr:hypothetical protein [Dawidia soli]MBT1688295.1 hypothetical protein [Dawidia soli]